jgi:hypothetical protein
MFIHGRRHKSDSVRACVGSLPQRNPDPPHESLIHEILVQNLAVVPVDSECVSINCSLVTALSKMKTKMLGGAYLVVYVSGKIGEEYRSSDVLAAPNHWPTMRFDITQHACPSSPRCLKPNRSKLLEASTHLC